MWHASLIVLALLACLCQLVYLQVPKLAMLRDYAQGQNPYAELGEIERHVRGAVVMTNGYPVSAGFFSKNASFGGCGLSSFEQDGRVIPSRCRAIFIKGYGGGGSNTIEPTRFILFKRDVYMEMSQCLDQCFKGLESTLAAYHRRIFDGDLFTIFALNQNG